MQVVLPKHLLRRSDYPEELSRELMKSCIIFFIIHISACEWKRNTLENAVKVEEKLGDFCVTIFSALQ